MKINKLLLFLITLLTSNSISAQAGEQFLGQIMWVSFDFVPKGWAGCNGQLLSINQNTALFSLLGTQYGGNGTVNFALPNLNGRTIIGSGSGPGLTQQDNGQMNGTERVLLTLSQIPTHNHAVRATTLEGDTNIPTANTIPANTKTADPEYNSDPTNTTLSSTAVGYAGGGLPHNNMQPYIGLKCIIA